MQLRGPGIFHGSGCLHVGVETHSAVRLFRENQVSPIMGRKPGRQMYGARRDHSQSIEMIGIRRQKTLSFPAAWVCKVE